MYSDSFKNKFYKNVGQTFDSMLKINKNKYIREKINLFKFVNTIRNKWGFKGDFLYSSEIVVEIILTDLLFYY